ncbi:MAG: phage terminase large subunit family protein [Pseudolabrys sp.]|nr:phage terminase large subunit family protein [Pseudolabrys sp.]
MVVIDPRHLRPSAALRVINATRRADVLTDRALRLNMNRGGLRVGDGQHLDLIRYGAWVFAERQKPRTPTAPNPVGGESAYERHRDRMAGVQADQSRRGREIGPIPPVVDPARRAEGEGSLRRFCEIYFPARFFRAWSPDHIKVLARMEDVIRNGGLFAIAMPRGSGKTSIVEVAVIFALVFGFRKYVALIGATEPKAEQMLDSIKIELQNNDLLLEDFPEVCFPIRKLERVTQRARAQMTGGHHTFMAWEKKEVVLPTVIDSRASGGRIEVAGLTGAIRGMKFTRANGAVERPDLVIPDDPQTDESAKSESQCNQREGLIKGAVLGLGGPGVRISGFMPCTIIEPDDMAARILDRKRNPIWQGERMQLVYRWAEGKKAEQLWETYRERRNQSFENGGKGETSDAHYKKNRKAMDAGALVAWEERKEPGELSALQHAWNIRIDRGDRAFFAEYQNDPLPAIEANADDLKPDEIASKVNGLGRADLPVDASALTMFIDVQQKALFWLIAAWAPDFTGSIVDYGTWPDQPADNYRLSEIRRTIARAIPKSSVEGGIYEALVKLCGEQLRREFKAANGATLKVSRCLVDANWGRSTEVVYQFARQGEWAGIVSPSHGKYYGASSLPFAEHKPLPGERIGYRWRIPPSTGRRAVRYVLFDTNWWKSFVADRMRVSVGDRGSLSLWGSPRTTHQMFAEHMTSERRIPVEARGRKVDEWRIKQPGLDNHFLDCIVGAAVAASVLGIATNAKDGDRTFARKRVRLSDLQSRKRMGVA